jgi:hypothetical protein
MQLCDVYLGLGEKTFQDLMRSISMGRLKTYQLFDRFKTRLHLTKLNSETLRNATPRVWARLAERDDEFATDLAQAILISHMDMIQAVLNHLKIPHDEGFFSKDTDVTSYLKEGWQGEVWGQFREKFPPAALLFYINHLAWEMSKADTVFAPAAQAEPS